MYNNNEPMQERYTDPCDVAEQEIQRSMDRALAEHKNKSRMMAKGKCWNCEEVLDNDLLFCDIECRDDYEWYCGRIGK